jgi:dephospho-CoA kinase
LLIVGLTGGIATGKTTVAEMLRQAGARVIDADRIAHAVTAPGEPAWQAIRGLFGQTVFQPDGAIDRKRLGTVVFNDPSLRRKLEEIIHPLVRSRIEDQVARFGREDPQALIVQDIPLLLETGVQSRFAEVILVYVPAEVQLQRLMHRDSITLTEARARINAQMPIAAKRKLATIIIDNSRSLDQTEAQVLQVYDRLAQRARQTSPWGA